MYTLGGAGGGDLGATVYCQNGLCTRGFFVPCVCAWFLSCVVCGWVGFNTRCLVCSAWRFLAWETESRERVRVSEREWRIKSVIRALGSCRARGHAGRSTSHDTVRKALLLTIERSITPSAEIHYGGSFSHKIIIPHLICPRNGGD